MRLPLHALLEGLALGAGLVGCGGDRVLREALRPASGEVVDCHGGALRPAEPWVEREPANELESLTDQVGILLHDVEGVRVENCTIEGFEYAILALGGGGHVISGNVLDSPFEAIRLESATDVEITGNEIRGGSGIIVARRSHRARIADNTIEQVHPGVPTAIGLWDETTAATAVYLHVVDDALYEVANALGPVEDVVIEDNEITLQATGDLGVFVGPRTRDAVIRGNTFSGGSAGIGLSGATGFAWTALPGTCAGDASRFCNTDRDCFIYGLDEDPLGACTFAGDRTCGVSGAACTRDCGVEDLCGYHVPESLVTEGARIEANTVTGACEGMWGYVAFDTTIEGNTLIGVADASHCEDRNGLYVQGPAFMTTRLIANTVNGYGRGLGLFQIAASGFGAQVTRNDFAGNEAPWWASAYDNAPMYDIELSSDGLGNHWGLTCDQGAHGFPEVSFCVGGFYDDKPCDGSHDCPSGRCEPVPVTDSHAFGAPIGEGSLPCPP